MSPRRFPAPPLGPVDSRVVLDAQTSHHLLRVTRVPRGTTVELFDGHRVARAKLADVEEGRAVCVLSEAPRPACSQPARTLVLALLKGPAMEHALRMATELGATDIWPVLTDRTVPKGDRADRWMRVLTGAARQCGREGPPALAPLQSLSAALSKVPDDVRCVFGAPGSERLGATSAPAALFIGPEGGWTPREQEALIAAGALPVGLGSRVLRADTAVAAGLALLG